MKFIFILKHYTKESLRYTFDWRRKVIICDLYYHNNTFYTKLQRKNNNRKNTILTFTQLPKYIQKQLQNLINNDKHQLIQN